MTTTAGVEMVDQRKVTYTGKPWAKARVGLDVWVWWRGEPTPRPAKITRIDMETSKTCLFVFHDGLMGTCITRETPHKSENKPEHRTSYWDFM